MTCLSESSSGNLLGLFFDTIFIKLNRQNNSSSVIIYIVERLFFYFKIKEN